MLPTINTSNIQYKQKKSQDSLSTRSSVARVGSVPSLKTSMPSSTPPLSVSRLSGLVPNSISRPSVSPSLSVSSLKGSVLYLVSSSKSDSPSPSESLGVLDSCAT